MATKQSLTVLNALMKYKRIFSVLTMATYGSSTSKRVTPRYFILSDNFVSNSVIAQLFDCLEDISVFKTTLVKRLLGEDAKGEVTKRAKGHWQVEFPLKSIEFCSILEIFNFIYEHILLNYRMVHERKR